MLNPHFDQGRIVWSDEYSGEYEPPPTGYDQQFELQWKVALEGDPHYRVNPGTCTDDAYIEDRVYEWTGRHPSRDGFHDRSMAVRVLDHPLDPDLIRGKRCVDVGCGMGRWTRTMQSLGASEVMSLDVSESALANVARYNPTFRRANILRIPEEHPDLVGRFDFANLWGVAMCTNDPLRAFLSAASTVKEGGSMFLMVYAPEGMHGTRLHNRRRRTFHALTTIEDRLRYVDHVWSREWDREYPLGENLKNLVKRVIRWPKQSKHGILDSLEPFYNWVIPLDVIHGWMRQAGFGEVQLLNEHQRPKCAYHVLGRGKARVPGPDPTLREAGSSADDRASGVARSRGAASRA